MSIRERMGYPSYPIPDRECDISYITQSEDRPCTVKYWIVEFINLKNFKVLYGYDNGNFDTHLGQIETHKDNLYWSFDFNKGRSYLKSEHKARLLVELKKYIDKTFEQEVLGDNTDNSLL